MQHQSASLRWMLNFNDVSSLKKKKKIRKGRQNKKKFILIFLALAACSEALPQAGLGVGSTNRETESTKLNVFLHCLFHPPRRKYKGREGKNLTDIMREGKVSASM